MNSHLYSERLLNFNDELKDLKIKNRNIAIFRLLVFVLMVVLVVVFFKFGIEISLIFAVLSLMPFLFLVQKSGKYKYKIRFTQELIRINQSELDALKGNTSNFDAGKEFIDNKHNYSFDLDIFGDKSIYQYINRTCTEGGADKLAYALKNPLIEANKIIERQAASKELSSMLDWRQEFRATGNISMKSDSLLSGQISVFQTNNSNKKNDFKFRKSVLEWLQTDAVFAKKGFIETFLNILPFVSLVLIVLLALGLLPVQIFAFYVVVQLGFYIFQKKKIDDVSLKVGRQIDILERYEKLLQLIEHANFKSQVLNAKQSKLATDNLSACKELRHLKTIIKYLDNRNNILFAFIANALVQWDMQCVLRLEKWRFANKNKLPVWLNVIYEFDFLSSMANFAHNNPQFATPAILDNKNFVLNMEEGGHPLIVANKRVNNSIIIDDFKKILLITGANMAGKSTFLRTIGVNMILAMSGAVVCAKSFALTPVRLHTSIRNADSVQNNESYFFAELKRLQSITESMKRNEGLFVIIDEMLRGTNSRDKHNGSQALIEQLIKYKTSGLLATHDIALGSLAEKYGSNVYNYRFEVEIEDDELVFDYKLKTGVSQNLNATFLMKKMGIIEKS